jgi:hypothetical protein
MAMPASDYQEIVNQVRRWDPELRLRLAEELLRSLHPTVRPAVAQGVPAEQVRGLAAGSAPPPEDDTLRRWVEEYRLGKHG